MEDLVNPVVGYLEEYLAVHKYDSPAKLAHAHMLFLLGRIKEGITVLENIIQGSFARPYQEWAALELMNIPDYDSSNLKIEPVTFESLTEEIISTFHKNTWPKKLLESYLGVAVRNPSMKWAPLAILEVVKFYELQGEHEKSIATARYLEKLYPRSTYEGLALVEIGRNMISMIIGVDREVRKLEERIELKGKGVDTLAEEEFGRKKDVSRKLQASLLELVQTMLERTPGVNSVKLAAFEFARFFEEKNELRIAMTIYQMLWKQYENDRTGARAHFLLGKHHYNTGSDSNAYATFLEHVSRYATLSDNLAEAEYLLGCILKSRGQLTDAIVRFKNVPAYYQDTWTLEAGRKCVEIVRQVFEEKKYEEVKKLAPVIMEGKFDPASLAEVTYLLAESYRLIAPTIASEQERENILREARRYYRMIRENWSNTVFSSYAIAEINRIDGGVIETEIKLDAYIRSGMLLALLVYFLIVAVTFAVEHLLLPENYYTFTVLTLVPLAFAIIAFAGWVILKIFLKMVEFIFG